MKAGFMAATEAEVSGEMLAAWLVTAVALALVGIGRRRLPVGVGEGLFVAGLSGLLLLSYASLSGATGGVFLLSTSLVSLAVVWFIVAVWVEREAVQAAGDENPTHLAARRRLGVHAASVAGLVAAAALLSAFEPAGVLTPGLVALLGLLLVVAGGLYVWRRGVLGRYAMVAVLVLLLRLAVPREFLELRRSTIPVMLLGSPAAMLVVVLVTVLSDWRRRRRVWRTEPERLTEPPPKHRRAYSLVVALCVAVGVGGVLLPDAVLTPLAVVLAALAALVVGHRWRSDAVGELGLALAAEGVVTAAIAWLPWSAANGLLGWALAGVYTSWLARFWQQQLIDGKPWTTAGRLIPAARYLSYATAGGQLLLGAAWALRPDGLAAPGGWQATVAALCMLLHWSMLVQDAATRQESTPALAGCVVLLAALVPIQDVGAGYGFALTPAVLLALAGVVLALRVGPARGAGDAALVYNAYIGGLIPVAVLYDLVLHSGGMTNLVTAIVAVVCVLSAVGVRWGGRGRTRGAPAEPASDS